MSTTDTDYRTELFRHRIPVYKAAARIDVHPSRLSLMLNRHIPMPERVKTKLAALIAAHQETAPTAASSPN